MPDSVTGHTAICPAELLRCPRSDRVRAVFYRGGVSWCGGFCVAFCRLFYSFNLPLAAPFRRTTERHARHVRVLHNFVSYRHLPRAQDAPYFRLIRSRAPAVFMSFFTLVASELR